VRLPSIVLLTLLAIAVLTLLAACGKGGGY